MSHLDELDEFEAELELTLKKEYSAVFGLFRYCVLTQDATYLCNKLDLQYVPQQSYPFFQLKMEDVWVWDKNRPTRIIPRAEVYTSSDVTVEELRGDGDEPTLDREQPVQQRAGSNGRDDLHGPVDEVTLLDISERLGLAQAGNTADLDAVLLAEQCERRSDRLPAAADVRAEADVAQDPIISLHKHAFGLVLLSRFSNSVSRNSDD